MNRQPADLWRRYIGPIHSGSDTLWTYNDNARHNPVNRQTIERVIISGGSYKDSLAIMLTFHSETWPLANYEDIGYSYSKLDCALNTWRYVRIFQKIECAYDTILVELWPLSRVRVWVVCVIIASGHPPVN